MLTGGHIAISYLLAESARSFGIPLTSNEVIGVIVAGNIIDIDFLVGLLNGKTGEAHHQNVTHTPFGTILIWIGIHLLFRPSVMLSALILAAMVIHLILDDIGYWAYRLKLYTLDVHSQVNWLYPFTPFHKHPLITSNKTVLKNYLFKAWPIALAEGVLIIMAVIRFMKNHL